MGFWRVMFRCGRIVGPFTVHTLVGYTLSGSLIVNIGVSCKLLRS